MTFLNHTPYKLTPFTAGVNCLKISLIRLKVSPGVQYLRLKQLEINFHHNKQDILWLKLKINKGSLKFSLRFACTKVSILKF